MRELTIDDLPRIMRLEKACFIPPVRASEACMRQRIKLGHRMLGIDQGDEIAGMISFLYADFSPDDYDRFPKTHAELSLQPMESRANTAFIYNLAVTPRQRGLETVRALLREAARRMLEAGRTTVVGSSRMPSYTGSLDHTEEQIPPSPELRTAVDHHLEGGPFPATPTLIQDPLLAFYQRLTGGSFLWIIPNFDPHDVASGGMGVVLHGKAESMLARLEVNLHENNRR